MKKIFLPFILLFSIVLFAQNIETISLRYDLDYNHKKIGNRHVVFSLKNDSIHIDNFLNVESDHFVKRTRIENRMYWDAIDIKLSDKSLEKNQKIIINEILNKEALPKENFKEEFLGKLKEINWIREKENNISNPIISVVIKFSNGDKKQYHLKEGYSSQEFIGFINYAKAFADWHMYKVYKTTPIQISYFRNFETKECFH